MPTEKTNAVLTDIMASTQAQIDSIDKDLAEYQSKIDILGARRAELQEKLDALAVDFPTVSEAIKNPVVVKLEV